MNLIKKVTMAMITGVALFGMVGCSPNTPEQKGYEKARDDIKNNLKVPSSFKVTNAQCYYLTIEKYVVGIGYPYQYFISYSAKNSFNMDVVTTDYYGYNDENDALKYYGSDSSKFDSAKSNGSKRDIKI